MPELTLFQWLVVNAPKEPLWLFEPHMAEPEPADGEAKYEWLQKRSVAFYAQWPWVYAQAVMIHGHLTEEQLVEVVAKSKPLPPETAPRVPAILKNRR